MPKTYYCTECKRNHRHGKIYTDHLRYKERETKKYDSEKVQKINFPLRQVAKNQIDNLINQIIYSPSRRDVYIEKINELIDHERKLSGNRGSTKI